MNCFKRMFFTCVAGSMVSVSGFSDIQPVPGTRPTSPINKQEATTSGQRSLADGKTGRARAQTERHTFKTEVRQNKLGQNEYTLKGAVFGRIDIARAPGGTFIFTGDGLDGPVFQFDGRWHFTNNNRKSPLRNMTYDPLTQTYTANFEGFKTGTVEVVYDQDGVVNRVAVKGDNGADLLRVSKEGRGVSIQGIIVDVNPLFKHWPNPVLNILYDVKEKLEDKWPVIFVEYSDDNGLRYTYDGTGDLLTFTQALAGAYSEGKIDQKAFEDYMNHTMKQGSGRYLKEVTAQSDAMFAGFDVVIADQANMNPDRGVRD